MKLLAEGSEKKVYPPIIVGSSVLVISALVDSVFGLGPLIGLTFFLYGILLGNAYRNPGRVIKTNENSILTPIDGVVESTIFQIPIGYRPSPEEIGTENHEIDSISGDWIMKSPENLDYKTEFLWKEVDTNESTEHIVKRIRIRKTFLDPRIIYSPVTGKIVAQELRLPVISSVKTDAIDYQSRLRMVFQNERGNVEMTIFSTANSFEPYLFIDDSVKQGDKLCLVHSNIIQVDVRVQSEVWDYSNIKSQSKMIEAMHDSIFETKGG